MSETQHLETKKEMINKGGAFPFLFSKYYIVLHVSSSAEESRSYTEIFFWSTKEFV